MKTRRIPSLVLALLCLALHLVAQEKRNFRLPQPNPSFAFPRDHGSHPDFKLEWWYVTGHLRDTSGGERFGYQATFFRQVTEDAQGGQIYLAHMALMDLPRKRFLYQTRLNREGWDGGSAVGKLRLHNGPWSLEMEDGSERMSLRGGVRSEVGFDFRLTPEKPLVRFGDAGFSRKGSDPGAASYYLTFTRLATAGTLRIGGTDYAIEGLSWLDHEISSSQLSAGLIGWDWVCIQLLDGRDVMLYRLRRSDGSSDPASTLTWVDGQGQTAKASFQWKPLGTWKSPDTAAEYPSRIQLSTTDPASGKPVSLQIEPLFPAQELASGPGGIAYWEGACRVVDDNGNEVGSAYLELTGYAKPLKL